MNLAGLGARAKPVRPDAGDGDADRNTARQPSRRRFLRFAGAGGSALLVAVTGGAARRTTPIAAPIDGNGDARGATVPQRVNGDVRLPEQEVAIMLKVAGACAVYPVPFPDFGERGPATARVTEARLRTRLAQVDTERLRQIRHGAQTLISAGAPTGSRDRLLDVIGRQVAAPGSTQPAGLVALMALAIATVSKRFDPNTDGYGALWLGAVRRRHARLMRSRQPAEKGRR